MRKPRNTLLIVLSALVILGMLAVAGHAQKVMPLGQSKPVSIVYVEGGVVGQGDPKAIVIEFRDVSFGGNAGTFISNPDYPPSLNVFSYFEGPSIKMQQLKYYYCDGSHGAGVSICSNSTHDPDNYKCLQIFGGIAQKRSNRVTFPAGSRWRISWKQIMTTLAEGKLSSQVTYDVR